MNLLRSIAALVALLLGACAHHAAADADRLTAALRSQPIVLLGEVHDNAAQHALRARALRALVEGGVRPALLMEQFDRERQAELDRVLATPGASADDVIAAAAPDSAAMQGWAWQLYRPYVALALEYRLPIVAANVSRADTRRVVQSGLATLGFDAAVPADIESVQASAIVEGHCGAIDAAQAHRMVGAQIARDQFMARMVEAHAAQGAVLLAGNGHVRSDVGVPRWLSAATRERSVAIGLLEEGDASAAAYAIALFTPPQPRADPCAGMRASAPAAKL